MKAIVCNEFSTVDALRLEDIDTPTPKAAEVLIDVKAAGINFPDILTVQGKYQFKPPLPFIPGVEVSGVVSKLGDGVTSLAVGDRVFATINIGGFAERCVAPAATTMPIGERMNYQQAAAFAVTYGTSYYALKQRAQIEPGETVLVLGAAGGVGIAAIQIAKAMGAEVIAAASSEEKLAFARDAGADHAINYAEQDLKNSVKTLTDGNGADIVYDPVGGEFSEKAFRSIAWNGRFLVIGFATGSIPKMPLNLALLKGASIVGVFWGAWAARCPEESKRSLSDLRQMIDAGSFAPVVTEIYALADFAAAFKCIEERRAKGKVVLSMN